MFALTGMAKQTKKSNSAPTKKKAPWDKSNPRKKSGKASKHLTPTKKAAAKASAKKAGRPYPNLVDNMKAAKTKTTKKKTAAKSKTAKKSSRKKSKKKAAKKSTASQGKTDPKGGLTAAGRRAFAKKDGAHLKPGVKKADTDMTPTEMCRKGSWALRFYGRAKLPPLVDDKGQPTRLALSAHAWGEPVPKTVAAARRIAAKGERLLKRYHRLKDR
jgi:hypothetical protein